jgi:hypothetical protein
MYDRLAFLPARINTRTIAGMGTKHRKYFIQRSAVSLQPQTTPKWLP